MSVKLEKNMQELNEIENFLKVFMEKHPTYQELILGKCNQDEKEYDTLMRMMEREWNKALPDQEFFLKNTSYHLEENFFIPYPQNVSIIKNLRYMPLILHSHQFIEVNYVLNAGDSYYIDKQDRLKLKDGDIILSPPNFLHTFETSNSDSVIIDIIIRVTTFDTAFFNLLSHNNYLAAMFTNLLYSSVGGYVLWRTNNEDPQLKELIQTMYEECCNADPYSDKMLEILIMQFFIILMRRFEDQAIFSAPYSNKSDERSRILLNYMHSHYQSVSLPQMSLACNYSERQIIRLLKKHTGKSYSALLQEIRMKKALSLLKNQEIPIPEIASLVGYSGSGYFLRVFKQTFPFTPEEFRHRHERLNEVSIILPAHKAAPKSPETDSCA